jgi:pimeloyl-ACP methyl ester carboxylesterase
MDQGTLDVPGAGLYYERSGSGPLLLCVPGGNGDAAGYGRIAPLLADRFTVVAYDRRGYSRSRTGRPPAGGLRLADDADDAARLIEKLGDGPAFVLGSSSGAIVGLELLTRRPELVRRLVAHEPPLARLVPDAEYWRGVFDRVHATFVREGAGPAMAEFNDMVRLDQPPGPPPGVELPPHLRELLARIRANLDVFLEHELRQYTATEIDLDALRPVAGRLVPAAGAGSGDSFPARPVRVLADRLGLEVAEFPGGHVAYTTEPVPFAARLAAVLG